MRKPGFGSRQPARTSRTSLFEESTGFEGFIFPGPVILANAVFQLPVSFAAAEFMLNANFAHAHFHGDVNFECAKFAGQAVFDDAAFDGVADFERTEFLKEKDGPLGHGVKFQRHSSGQMADFRGSIICRKRRFFEGPVCRHGPLRRGPLHRRRPCSRARSSPPPPASTPANSLRSRGVQGLAVHRRGPLRRSAVQRRMRYGAQPILGRRFLPRRPPSRKMRPSTPMRVEGASRFPGTKFSAQADFLESRFAGACRFCGRVLQGAPRSSGSPQFQGRRLVDGMRVRR